MKAPNLTPLTKNGPRFAPFLLFAGVVLAGIAYLVQSDDVTKFAVTSLIAGLLTALAPGHHK